MDKNNHVIQSLDTIKKLAGMLKYVHSNKNGKVEIELLASKLSVSTKLTMTALNTLVEANAIEVKEESKKEIFIDYKNSVNLNQLEKLNTFKTFKTSILEEMNFKDFVAKANIEEIKNYKNIFAKV